jgi:RNA polymerase sigma-70 factor (ECF subfamily)
MPRCLTSGGQSIKRAESIEDGAEREAGFRRLYEAHNRAVLGYALRRARSSSDAAEVVAETMMVAWRRFDSVPPGDAALMWLYGVAHKILANQTRGNLRRSRLFDRMAATVETSLPDTSAVSNDQMWIKAALATLPAADFEVLTLTAWEGLAPGEIAAALGLPAATVRTRLHRARARLRAELVATSPEATLGSAPPAAPTLWPVGPMEPEI